jgi:hypothetical protein
VADKSCLKPWRKSHAAEWPVNVGIVKVVYKRQARGGIRRLGKRTWMAAKNSRSQRRTESRMTRSPVGWATWQPRPSAEENRHQGAMYRRPHGPSNIFLESFFSSSCGFHRRLAAQPSTRRPVVLVLSLAVLVLVRDCVGPRGLGGTAEGRLHWVCHCRFDSALRPLLAVAIVTTVRASFRRTPPSLSPSLPYISRLAWAGGRPSPRADQRPGRKQPLAAAWMLWAERVCRAFLVNGFIRR